MKLPSRNRVDSTTFSKKRSFSDVVLQHTKKIQDLHKRYLVIRIDQDTFKGFFKEHHKALIAIGFSLIFLITIVTFYSSVRASVAKFYPTSCLGGWEHPENVQGEPSLAFDSSAGDYTLNNSARMKSSSGPLYCGGFKGEIPTNTNPTHFKVSLNLSVDDGSVVHAEPKIIDENSPDNSAVKIPDTNSANENTASVTAPTETPAPDVNLPATETPAAEPAPETAPAALQQPQAEASPEAAPASEQTQAVAPVTADGGTPPEAVAPTPQPDSQQSFLYKLNPFASLAALVESSLQDSAPAAPAPDSFLEVDYTLDGTNWNTLGNISRADWKNNSFDLPLDDWTNLDHLQIAVKTLPTYDDPSTVYLDSIEVAVEYDDIATPPENLTVKIKDPSNIISSEKDDFNSNESPTFTITNPNLHTNDLKALVNENKAEVLSDPNGALGEPSVPSDKALPPENLLKPATDTVNKIISPPDTTTPQNNSQNDTPVSFNFFSIAKAFASSSEKPVITARVKNVVNGDTDIPVSIETIVVNGVEQQQVKIQKPKREFRPGLYRLQISMATSEATIISEQDFTWGVLAINLNKSVYVGGDDAYIQMGVLSDMGHTICNADLNLKIVAPDGTAESLSTASGAIVREKECGPDNVIDVPDYYAYYKIPANAGKYEMILKAHTANGDKTVSDSFSVDENNFSVERVGPTRIYPVATYPMTLFVTAKEDWSGTVTEKVPASFEISPPSKSTTYDKVELDPSDANVKIISWDVTLAAGEEARLGYRFDAPDLSPDFYLLGKAELTNSNGAILFQEYRNWQIAADATITSNATGTFEATAWPNTLRTGTITSSTANANITGTGTSFTTEINPGNIIKTTGNVAICTVSSVTDATHLVCTGNSASTNTNISYNVQGVGPGDAVSLASGFTATLTSNNNTVSSLTLLTTSLASQLVINNGTTLTVTGNMVMNAEASAVTMTVTLGSGAGAGNLTVGSLTMNGGNAANVGGGKIGCSASGTGTLLVTGSGKITVNGSSTASNTGSTSIDMSAGACNVTTGTVAGTVLTLAGGSSGASPSAIMKMGTGTLTMNGNLAFTGSTASKDSFNMSVSGGTLKLNAATLPVVGTAGTYNFASTTNLTNNSGSSTISYATAVTTWNALNIAAGTLNLTGANETFTGITIANGATLNTTKTITDSGAGASALVCSTTSGSAATISGAAGAITMSGASAQLSSGSAGCNVTATGTFTISGATAPQITTSSVYTFAGTVSVSTALTNNGTVTANAATSLAGAGNWTNAAGSALTIGGTSVSITTLTANSTTNTVTYTGAITMKATASHYKNLVINSSGTVTAVSDTVDGTLTVSAGTFLMSNTTGFTVTGQTTVNGGTLNITGSTTAKLFSSLVTVSSGTLSGSSTTIQFAGGLTQSSTGVVSITGTGTFQTTAAQALNGTIAIATLSVSTGVTLTNNGTTTVSTSLTGVGGFTNAASSILNIGFASAPSITTLTTSNTTPDNTVNYTAAAPNCKIQAYDDLSFTGSGAITCATLASVTGDLSLSTASSMTWTTGANLIVGGGMTIGNGVTFTQGSTRTLEVDGLFTVGGGSTGVYTCAATAGTLTLKGDLTLAVGSTWTDTNCGTTTFSKGGAQSLTDNTATKQDLGVVTTATASTAVTTMSNVTMTTLTIAGSTTFDLTNDTLILNGTGTPLSVSGTFTTTGSTVKYVTSTVVPLATTYNNLEVSPNTNSGSAVFGAGTFTINGNLVIGNGTQTLVTVTAATNASTLTVSGNFTISNNTTFTANASNALSVGGNFTLGATSAGFNHNNGTVNFTSTSTGKIITGPLSSSNPFFTVNFTGSGGDWISAAANDIQFRGLVTISNGTFKGAGSGGNAYFLGGLIGTGSGIFNTTAGVVVYNHATSGQTNLLGGAADWTFGAGLTLNGSNGAGTITGNGAGSITVSGSRMTLLSNVTLNGGSNNWILSAIGQGAVKPLEIQNGSSFVPQTSTITYTGNGATDITPNTYYNLVINPSGNVTHFLVAGTYTVNNDLTLGGSNTVIIDGSVNPTLTITRDLIIQANATLTSPSAISLGRNFTNSGTFTSTGNTLTFTGAVTHTITGATTFNNISDTVAGSTLAFQNAGVGQTTPVFTFAGTLTTSSGGTNVTITSDDAAHRWLAHFNSSQSSVSNATISWSGCDGTSQTESPVSSTNGGNNGTCWNFGQTITFANSDSAIGFGNFSSSFVTYANASGTGSISDTTAHTFTISTSAGSGYTLTYLGPTLTSGANTIAAATAIGTGGTAGTAQFAMSGTMTSSGTGAMATNYNHATPKWTFVPNATTTIASSSGSVSGDTVDMHYEANIAGTTKAGDYTTTVTFLLTGNF